MLDLKMPGLCGFGFLEWLRNNPDCRVIPVIVFSSSRMESDVREAYRLGANSYLMKPGSLAEMAEVLEATYQYWPRCECPPVPVNCEDKHSAA